MQNHTDNPVAAPSTFGFDDAVRLIKIRKWMILAIAVAVPTIVGVVVSKRPRIYQAEATIVIDSTVPQYLGQNFRDIVDLESSWWSAQETMQTELRVMASYSQALALANALCAERKGSRPALELIEPGAICGRPGDLNRAARSLQGMVHVETIKDSRIVKLSVQGTDPEMTALLANTSAKVYMQRNLERRIADSEGAATWLGGEYGDLTTQLNEAERQLIDFKRRNNVVTVGLEDQQNDLSNRRKRFSDELNRIEVELIGLKAQRGQYAALKGGDALKDPLTPGVGDNPVVLKLKELYLDQYAKLLELKGKYLDKHPAVVTQQARVDAIKGDLDREAGLAAKGLEVRYSTVVKEEADLKAAIDSATRESLQLEQRSIEYNRLKRNLDRLLKLSEQVGGRERETSLVGHLKTNNVRILDAAQLPTGPISPDVGRAVLVAILIGLILAFGLAYLLELLDVSVKSQDDIERRLNIPFLGLLPTIASSEKMMETPLPERLGELLVAGSKDLQALAHPKSAVAECCRAIRTNILFASPDNPPRTILVTSAGPQEGKSTTAINIAISMAQSGQRVLLMDTDMRRPRLDKAFGLPANPNGISSAIAGTIEVFQAIQETGIPRLSLLPCGVCPPNPAELLHATKFRQLLTELLTHFDRVLLDSPPIGSVTDASILSRMTDGTVLVAKANRTSRNALERATRLLNEANVNILGCILNDLDVDTQGGYNYYYYSRYGYHGGYEPAKAAGGRG